MSISRKRKKKRNLKIAKLILEGKANKEIINEVKGINIFDVTGMRGFLSKPAGIKWAYQKGIIDENKVNELYRAKGLNPPFQETLKGAETVSTIADEGESTVKTEETAVNPSKQPENFPLEKTDLRSTTRVENIPGPIPSPAKPTKTPLRNLTPSRQSTLIEMGEKVVRSQIEVLATPVIRKTLLNPKVLMFYDYARSRLGFKGDLGDFLQDCVEDFFKSRNYVIKVVKEEIVD